MAGYNPIVLPAMAMPPNINHLPCSTAGEQQDVPIWTSVASADAAMVVESAASVEEKQVVTESSISKKYVLTGEIIYRGLASTIFLGVERKTLLHVGIKVMVKSRFDSQEEHNNALREIQIHGSLGKHPNVIRLVAAEATPTGYVIVTPYTPHGDLNELTRYGKTYCESEVRHCAAQMLSALHHVHDAGIAHCDIKPANFLMFKVDGRYAVQLIDFGLAERPDHQEVPGFSPGAITFRGVRGTSGWFSPEMLAHRDYTQAIDIWGVGLILYRMLGGYHPFDPPSRFTQEIEFDDTCWCHIGPICRSFLMKLLTLEPSERGTAESLRQEEWITTEPPAPDPELLKAMSKWGPPPCTDVLFWPVCSIPAPHMRMSYADLTSFQDTEMSSEEEFPEP